MESTFGFVYNSNVFALVYILLIVLLGDMVCRCFFSFVSVQHRIAAAFLTGLLFSGCVTYLFALLFAGTAQPLLWANTLFLMIAIALIYWLRRGIPKERLIPRPPGSAKWDWLCLGVCLIFGCWLMFATLSFTDGSFNFAIKSWSDFGANLSVSQSLALGHNFPTEHPFFPSEIIRYHFLFWFQAANLSFLGLNIVWSVNLLSIFSLMALLALVMTLAELLFNSRSVGRIAAILFFFASSSLSYIPFLLSQSSVSGAVGSILGLKDFLKSGYPFRGEDWGALSVAVFSNQRHLISGVGILFVVLIFLVDFYKRRGAIADLKNNGDDERPKIEINMAPESEDFSDENEPAVLPEIAENVPAVPSAELHRGDIAALIFCGVVIGALPYWNSAVFASAAIIIGSLLLVFPQRRYLAILIVTAVIIGLPQVLMLRSGNLASSGQSLFHWGYIVANPTIPLVFDYIVWTYGFKLLLLLAAVWFVPNGHRRLLLALSALVPVVFLLQLSTDAFNNHKLLNIWNTVVSVYVAYPLWVIGRKNFWRASAAVMLAMAMVVGAVIDLFPLHNDAFVTVPFKNDRLTTWLFENTQPADIFLTNTLLAHPILFTGRKIYLGNTLFAWTAGYELAEREKTYRKMFQELDPAELTRLLRENKIALVAIDDGLRSNGMIKGFNESIFENNFEKVFDDTERKYGNLRIYRIPALPPDASP